MKQLFVLLVFIVLSNTTQATFPIAASSTSFSPSAMTADLMENLLPQGEPSIENLQFAKQDNDFRTVDFQDTASDFSLHFLDDGRVQLRFKVKVQEAQADMTITMTTGSLQQMDILIKSVFYLQNVQATCHLSSEGIYTYHCQSVEITRTE